MSKQKIAIFLFTFFCVCNASAQKDYIENVANPVDWVNTLMGSDSDFSLSNGNTYPAVALPWGMNFWTPQTSKMGDGWLYAYAAKQICGIKQTHQPSPWINDYGQFAVLPTVGAPVFEETKRASYFSHKAEIATPYYYSVYLADYDVTAEIAPTERAAQILATYPQTTQANFLVDCFDKNSYIKVDIKNGEIIGYSTKNSGGVPENFRNYFVIKLNKPIEKCTLWCDSVYNENANEISGNHVGAIVSFATRRGEKVTANVASSFISFEQARLNLKNEVGSNSFEQTKNAAKAAWNKELSRFKVGGGNYDDIGVFYTSLYRTMLFPRKFYEINAEGKIVHYSPYNGQTLPGYMFTDNGFWDTFRAVFPFFTLFYPELTAHIMDGLANSYKESGWLPEWASPGHRDCMIGSNSASIIAGAYLNGIRNFDIETLYETLLKNSENANDKISSVGRRGVEYYNKLGYVPYDVKINENAARTLEYAYDDYCLYRLAQELGKSADEIEKFKQRSQNYKNLYDKESGLMRGRLANGEFAKPFNPFKWGDAFTEGNAWHYTWSVFHDVEGLIQLMGGNEKFVQKLDSMFIVPPIFDNSYYGFTIHEIREMQIMNMGNYAHGNQPVQHAIYLYNYAGEPWKTQQRVRDVMTRFYNATPDGYCGDEDNGQTSAWFAFSAMGFYPVCPASNQFVIGSPLFKHVSITFPNGKIFNINSENNNNSTPYVEKATLNGKNFNRTFIFYDEISRGGNLNFTMSKTPNKHWAVDKNAIPFSITKKQ